MIFAVLFRIKEEEEEEEESDYFSAQRSKDEDFVLHLLSMDSFDISEVKMLTNASLHGEFRSHLNRLLIDFPDDCPKASDIMLFFLSCLADAELVLRLITMRVIGSSENVMYIQCRRLRVLRNLLIHHYPDQCQRLLFKGFEGINLSDWPEIYREEQRKHNQAKYALRFKVAHKQRFLGVHCSEADLFDRLWLGILSRKRRLFKPDNGSHSARLQLQIEKLKTAIWATDVTILPKVGVQGGETIAGTLEAHATGFVYIASGFRMCFDFDSIRKSFFRLGDKRMPPLLHFHLRDPIPVGTEKTKDIQFRLMQCPLGQKRSDQDSDEIVKKKEIRVENEDLKNFVDKVRERWNFQLNPPRVFEELETEYEFYGVLPSMASAGFALTLFSLVVLEETKFLVVPLYDIDIVNLALLRPGEIDMTVICQDFKVDSVLEINSIPLKSLASIKDCLDNASVKYYVNAKNPDWKSIVKDIVDFPAKFMENGGWDHFELEDSHTLAYYKETGMDPFLATLEG